LEEIEFDAVSDMLEPAVSLAVPNDIIPLRAASSRCMAAAIRRCSRAPNTAVPSTATKAGADDLVHFATLKREIGPSTRLGG
jgi:hypothetical protein